MVTSGNGHLQQRAAGSFATNSGSPWVAAKNCSRAALGVSARCSDSLKGGFPKFPRGARRGRFRFVQKEMAKRNCSITRPVHRAGAVQAAAPSHRASSSRSRLRCAACHECSATVAALVGIGGGSAAEGGRQWRSEGQRARSAVTGGDGLIDSTERTAG